MHTPEGYAVPQYTYLSKQRGVTMFTDLYDQIRLHHEHTLMESAMDAIATLKNPPISAPLQIRRVQFVHEHSTDFLWSDVRVEGHALYLHYGKTVGLLSMRDYNETACAIHVSFKDGSARQLRTTLSALEPLFDVRARHAVPRVHGAQEERRRELPHIKRTVIECLMRRTLADQETWLNEEYATYVREGLVTAYGHLLLGTAPTPVVENEWTREYPDRIAHLFLGLVGYYTFPTLIDALNRCGPPRKMYLSPQYLEAMVL